MAAMLIGRRRGLFGNRGQPCRQLDQTCADGARDAGNEQNDAPAALGLIHCRLHRSNIRGDFVYGLVEVPNLGLEDGDPLRNVIAHVY